MNTNKHIIMNYVLSAVIFLLIIFMTYMGSRYETLIDKQANVIAKNENMLDRALAAAERCLPMPTTKE